MGARDYGLHDRNHFALGGPIALARDKHIRVRIIYDTVSQATRKKLDVFNTIITFLFSIAMSYAAFVLFWRSSHNPSGAWQLERSGTSWNPPFPALTKGIILMALAIMTLQSILHVIKAIRALSDNNKVRRADYGRTWPASPGY